MVLDANTRAPDIEMIESDNVRHLMTLLDQMDEREAAVLRMRYGLDDHEPMTLQEIGARLGLTRERVRQIGTEALAKLSQIMQEQ